MDLIASLICFIPIKNSLLACLSCISSLTCLYATNSSSNFSLFFSISSSYSFTIKSILALNSLHVSHKSTFHPSDPFSIVDGLKHLVLCSNLGYLHVLHSLSHSPFFNRLSNLSFSSSSLHSLTNILVILNSLNCTATGGMGEWRNT